MNVKKKGCLTVFIAILSFFIIIGIVMNLTMDDLKTGIASQIDVTQEQGENIDAILKECGIENIQSITPDELLNNAHQDEEKGYRINTSDVNIILYLDSQNKVYLINYAGKTLYENGKVVGNLKDYYLTTEEASNLQLTCEECVKRILKAPSTAKFPNILDWKFQKDKDIVIVQSYVDSQNGFGAMLRSNFQITLNTTDKKVISFIFDGKELIKN